MSYCTHHIKNSVAEGMNSKIMAIKRRVGGYRNRENFKTAIYFYCGGINLYPRQTQMDHVLSANATSVFALFRVFRGPEQWQ